MCIKIADAEYAVDIIKEMLKRNKQMDMDQYWFEQEF